MKITIINKKSSAKPSGFCTDIVDAPPLSKQ